MMRRERVLTCKEMSAADSYTQEQIGIPAAVLMERAALYSKEVIEKEITDYKRRKYLVFAGRGNNGADALVLARLLHEDGMDVIVILSSNQGRCTSLFDLQLRILANLGIVPLCYEETPQIIEQYLHFCPSALVVIDGLTGNGFRGALRSPIREICAAVNAAHEDGAAVISLDLPTGIGAEDAAAAEDAIRADHTVLFGFYRVAALQYPAAAYCGKLHLSRIGMHLTGAESTERFTIPYFDAAFLPKRQKAGNKGTFGKVLLIGGGQGAGGCGLLMAQSAQSAGAGMVRLFTHADNKEAALTLVPETIITTYSDHESYEEIRTKLKEAILWADAVAIGPGISITPLGEWLLTETLQLAIEEGLHKRISLVIDADAIRIIASNSNMRSMIAERKSDTPIVFTPHMGEFASLAGSSISSIKAAREDFVTRIAAELNAAVVLKDARTLVASSDKCRIFMNVLGNEGMATAGSGDVLCGLIAALCGEMRTANGYEEAVLGVLLHAAAGDYAAAQKGTRSLTAVDIVNGVCNVLKKEVVNV